ncbi:ArsR/SmtB family transcription factor [Dactylosporangium sp. CA-152071]|uniref:ArsR/SmtB family transcription factor n=1 Tax=Dactylosporangium sp. CA-152071 TaxID=3239933 RepID=UPI003D8E315C
MVLTLTDLNAVDAPCCPPIAQDRIPAETAAVLAPAFKALGDPVRLQLMSMIASADGGEICVCDLTPAFDLSGPTISHHLRTLREAGLVSADRRGTWVYYRARPGIMRRLAALLTVTDPA